MKKSYILFIGLVVALVLVACSFSAALARDTMPDPIDPQSWQQNRDRTWDNFVPNPVIDWLSDDFNPQGLMNSKALQEIAPNVFNRDPADVQTPIRGAVILVDFIDKPFITTQPLGSDLFGFGLSTGKGFESKITKNPVINHPDRDTLADWWCDFLNKKLMGPMGNSGASFNEFYRENTYGKWGVEFVGFGPYTLNGLEFQYTGTGSTGMDNNDKPPSLRFTGSLMSEATAAARAGADGKAAWDPDEFDFFFVIHSGYDESGVWLNFGMMQWSAITLAQAKKVVPDMYGSAAYLTSIEELFTAHPEHVERLATKSGSTAFVRNEAAKIAAMRTDGTVGAYEFKFPASEWEWAESTGNASSTRYVAWTSWAARVGYWSGAGSWSYTSAKYGNRSRSIRQSAQGENDGMATFAHEFGHISGIGDNYDNPYTYRSHPRTEPWELMSRGSFAGPFGDQARWTVPGIEGGSVPTNFMVFNKYASSSYDDGDVLIVTNQQLAARTPLVAEIVARNVPLNNRVVDGKKVYQWLEDEYGLVSPNYYKALQLNFGSGAWADQAVIKSTGFSQFPGSTTRMYLEVVQRTGYDSYAPDDGVLIARNNRVVDAHPDDIAMIEYVQKDGFGPGVDDYVSYTLGAQAQLYDAAFHAGKSVTDTGYYRSEYDPADPNYNQEYARYYAGEGVFSWQKAMIKPGSVHQWEPRNGREIASGDTVNEWHDTRNKLHYYILEKHMNPGKYGEFLSYSVGLLHDDGVAVGGELEVEVAELETETPGKVAVASFEITNTGDATDIIRVDAVGDYAPVILNDLYAIEAGETITVPVYVQLPYGIRTLVNSSQEFTLTASSESNGDKVGEASVLIQDLIAYNYEVKLVPDKETYYVGQTMLVDVILNGDDNFTILALDVAYDTELLKYETYTYLTGWSAAVTAFEAGKVSVRSMPSSNMVLGGPANLKVATLKFTVKADAAVGSTALTLPSVMITPAGTVKDFGTAPYVPAEIIIDKVGDESFQKNLAIFPGLYDAKANTSAPVFQYSTGAILEEVYVECPLDTDFTGQRDLIRVQIRRPAESAQAGVRVPALFENSPYRDGTLNIPNHSVTPELKANASTAHYTYGYNIESLKPRASEWPWSDAANSGLGIPASHGAKPFASATRITSMSSIGPGSFGNYLVPRGYALIAGASIGNRYSDGYTSCGDVDETVAAMAVIQWLNGKARAYKNQACTEEIDATNWCNGNVAMSGVSYNGTLPIAVACSGVEGLKAIIPASAISSWYDYYRENGGVIAPGAYQGEDADVLAKYCNSRSTRSAGIPSNDAYYNNTPNMFGIGIRDQFNQFMTKMYADQDRDSGDYSRFWDDRNYLATADQVKAGVIVTHGLNDWNVKTKQFDQFYRAVKEKTDTPIKLVLHRGAHTGIYTHEAFFRNAHKWLDYYLYGIDNGIVESMPELSIISSQTGQYEGFDSWPVPGSEYTNYYLVPDVNGAAGALSLTAPAESTKTVKDSQVSATLANWETRIVGAGNLTAASTERLAFVADITQNTRFSGTVKATLEVASDKPFGYITCALVEIGPSRSFATVTAESIAAHNGVSAINITRPNSVSAGTTTSYKIAALGHADIQNPNPSGKTYMDSAATNYIPEYYYQTVATVPGQFYSYTFEFEANDWEFRAGNKMAIMVYQADYRYTPTPTANVPTLTVKLGAGSYVAIPSIGRFPTIVPPAVPGDEVGEVVELLEVVEAELAEMVALEEALTEVVGEKIVIIE